MPDQRKPNWTDGFKYWSRKAKAKWDKHGGKFCTIAGTTGLFLTGVHASRNTYKHRKELEENGERMRRAKEFIEGEKKSARYKRIAKEYATCTLKTSKHYVGDAVAGALSAYVNSKGWKKEHMHYKQASAMAGLLAADFMNYRMNVISEHGKDADLRYMTQKSKRRLEEEAKAEGKENKAISAEQDGMVVQLNPNDLRIWYSKETTPLVWSQSHCIRMDHLRDITNQLEIDLMYGGSYSVNDVRRHFYGRRGDCPAGNIFGRVWDPGNPEHPERGARVNLHYEDDEDFMSGLTDGCWIIIDIDTEPLFEMLANKKKDPLTDRIPTSILKLYDR